MLCRRYKEAVKAVDAAEEVVRDLEASSDQAQLVEWKAVEARAREERHFNLSVMEPYEVMQEKGRS